MKPLELTLPWPPSVNTYWRNAGRTLLSQKARVYRRIARTEIEAQLWAIRPRPCLFTRPVAVEAILHPPDMRKRDLDNLAKAILDVLTLALVWSDDSLVHDLRLMWGEMRENGLAEVTIRLLEDG